MIGFTSYTEFPADVCNNRNVAMNIFDCYVAEGLFGFIIGNITGNHIADGQPAIAKKQHKNKGKSHKNRDEITTCGEYASKRYC